MLRTIVDTGSVLRSSTHDIWSSPAQLLLHMPPAALARYSMTPPAAHGSQFDLARLAKRYGFAIKEEVEDGFESEGDEYDDESYEDASDSDEDAVSLDMRVRWGEVLSRIRCADVVEAAQNRDHTRDMWRGIESLFEGLIDQLAQVLYQIARAQEAAKAGDGSDGGVVPVMRPQLSKMDHEIVRSIRTLLGTLERVQSTGRCLIALTSPSAFSLAGAYADYWLQYIGLKLSNAKAHMNTMMDVVAARVQAVRGKRKKSRASSDASAANPAASGTKLKYVIPDRQQLVLSRTHLAQALAEVSSFEPDTVLQEAQQKCSTVLKCANTGDEVDAEAQERRDLELWMRQEVLFLVAKATTTHYLAPCFDAVATMTRVAQRDSIPRVKHKLSAAKERIHGVVKRFWGPRHRTASGVGDDLDVIDLLCTASDIRAHVQSLVLDFRDSLAEIAKYRKGIARLHRVKADIQRRVNEAAALAGSVVMCNQHVARAHADLQAQLDLLADERCLARLSQDKALREALLDIAREMNRKASMVILLVLASSVDYDKRAAYASELVMANHSIRGQMQTIRDSAEETPNPKTPNPNPKSSNPKSSDAKSSNPYGAQAEAHVRMLQVVGGVLRRKVHTYGLYTTVAKAKLSGYASTDAPLPTVPALVATCSAELSADQNDHESISAAIKRFKHDVASSQRYLELKQFAFVLRKRMSRSKKRIKQQRKVVVEVGVNKNERVKAALNDLKKALSQSKNAVKQVTTGASRARSIFKAVLKGLVEANKVLAKTDISMAITVETIVQEQRDRLAAATTIAGMYRSFVARRRVEEMKRQMMKQRCVEAAIAMCKWWRKTRERIRAWHKREKAKAENALTIQRVWRGYKSRRRTAIRRRVRKAPLITGVYRGYRARQNYKKLKAEAILHRFFRRSLMRMRARKKIRARRERWAAWVLQKQVRRYLARLKELREQARKAEVFRRNHCARVIQRKLLRPYFERVNAATRMQAVVRGFLQRHKNQHVLIAASVQLQRVVRMRLLRDAPAPSLKVMCLCVFARDMNHGHTLFFVYDVCLP